MKKRRKALVEKLEAPEQAVELLEQMDNALLSVLLDSEEYERKAEFLSILHQYVEGTYTIFPEKKQAVEIAVPEQGQISMFDFMEQEPQSKEQSTAAAVEEPQKAKVVARYQSTVMMQEGYIEDCAIRGIAFQELNGFFVSGNFILMCRTVQLLVARLQKFFVCSLCGKILPQIVNLLVQPL